LQEKLNSQSEKLYGLMESLWGNDDFSLGHDDFSMGMAKRFKAIEAIFVKKCVFLDRQSLRF